MTKTIFKITDPEVLADVAKLIKDKETITKSLSGLAIEYEKEMIELQARHAVKVSELLSLYDDEMVQRWYSIVQPYLPDGHDVKLAYSSGSAHIETAYFEQYGDVFVTVWPVQESTSPSVDQPRDEEPTPRPVTIH